MVRAVADAWLRVRVLGGAGSITQPIYASPLLLMARNRLVNAAPTPLYTTSAGQYVCIEITAPLRTSSQHSTIGSSEGASSRSANRLPHIRVVYTLSRVPCDRAGVQNVDGVLPGPLQHMWSKLDAKTRSDIAEHHYLCVGVCVRVDSDVYVCVRFISRHASYE